MGIDFGGVIATSCVDSSHARTGVAHSSRPLIARDGVYEALHDVVAAYAGNVWIVSKAGPGMQAKTLSWLEAEAFFARTRMSANQVRFCPRREDKAQICRDLGITHFVDDRIHIMQILRDVVPHLYLFGDPGGAKQCPPWATFVQNWQQVAELLIPSVDDGTPASR
ncbi:MAG: hypothetical protein IPG61_08495 [bacterium]|nr:hypothetical protein [bacterium]